ncbi:hypothetical protein ACGFMM_02650 [Streptomyces sp. NPDC048604]|uniref:hypothetical protein n=1 Tax=Streptomyces sp. NPDC048604 TaxID=3365578 RepID=UPI00371A32BD
MNRTTKTTTKTTKTTNEIERAVRNNALWCEAMCRAHGRPGVFGPRAWTNARRTPLYYPDAVTLTADATVGEVLAGIDRGTPYASVKDSYATLDLEAEGFVPLFSAEWIHRPAERPAPAPTAAEWTEVRTAEGLAAWEAAWRGDDEDAAGLFRAELLADPTTTVLAGRDAASGRVVAGAVLTEGAGVVGVSNLFATDATDGTDATGEAGVAEAWAGALTAAAARWPALPVVGYEHGDALTAAVAAGFTATAPLRVWLAPAA